LIEEATMTPDANTPANDDQQIQRADAIEDLSSEITAAAATQVKGGFDPQPDPPRLFDPPQIAAKIVKY
jgi:hypothetical protein